MCGRFTQNLSWAELHRLADLVGLPENMAPRFNIAPTDQAYAICSEAGERRLVRARWGLIPSWWKKTMGELPATFNARAETLTERPMFSGAFRARRCIIPVSGFYEWTGEKANRTPHYFSSPDGLPLPLAGLWERWRDPASGEDVLSISIIVGPASAWMKPYHERMPIILDWRNAQLWMVGETSASLLRPASETALQEWTVSARANKAGVNDDDPSLIAPV